jgi:hypothetical protein
VDPEPRGDILAADGTLVASYAQEALLRFRDQTAQAGSLPTTHPVGMC